MWLTPGRCRVALALALVSVLAVPIEPSAITAAALADGASSLQATAALIEQQLSHAGQVKFTSTLQDMADEDKSGELEFSVAVSNVSASPDPCHLSYHQQVQRDGVTSEQQVQLSLHTIANVVVEPFENYQNEWESRPGFVYVMTDPSITAVVLVGPNHSANWLAFVDAGVAAQVGAALSRAVGLCASRHG